jgi:rfaE bifunctional protein nucleotidyltransferase chain/domain
MQVSFTDLYKLKKKHTDEKIVFGRGSFDLLHSGHIDFLRTLKQQGRIVVVGINGDVMIKDRKGPTRPIQRQGERTQIIDSIRYVDYVFIMPYCDRNEYLSVIGVLKKLRPDVYITREKLWQKHEAIIKGFGAILYIDSTKKRCSTSSIIKRIVRNQ